MDEQIQKDGALGVDEGKATKNGENPNGKRARRKGKGGKRTWVTKATNEAANHTFLTSQRLMLESVISLKFMRWVDWAWWVSHV